MFPSIQTGNAILFDTADTRAHDVMLYVIQIDANANSEYQIKRAMALDGVTYFVADNPAGAHG